MLGFLCFVFFFKYTPRSTELHRQKLLVAAELKDLLAETTW